MELLSCPFCSNTDLDEYHNPMTNKIGCQNCDFAIEHGKWNTRHTPWISVKDRLPDNKFKVIVYTKWPEEYLSIVPQDYEIRLAHYHKDSDEWEILHNRYDIEVTHWMPLPSLPEEK